MCYFLVTSEDKDNTQTRNWLSRHNFFFWSIFIRYYLGHRCLRFHIPSKMNQFQLTTFIERTHKENDAFTKDSRATGTERYKGGYGVCEN